MNLYEAIKARRSVRKFRPDPVPTELVMKVLDAANWAPSGMNQQPWKFYIVHGQKLSSIARDFGAMVEKNMPPVADAMRRCRHG